MAVSRGWTNYAITKNGALYGWGENWEDTIGLSGGKIWQPTRIMLHVDRVSMDNYKLSTAITESGELYMWGFYADRIYEIHDREDWTFTTPEKIDCGDTAVADVVAQGTDTLILTQEGGLYLWNISWVYDVGWDLKQVTTGVMVPKQLQREPKPPEEPGNRSLDQKGIFDAEYFVDPAGDLYSFADGTAKQVTTPGKVSYCDDDLIITRDGSLYLWEGKWVKKEGLLPVLKAARWKENGIAITMSGVYVWENVYTGDDANWNPKPVRAVFVKMRSFLVFGEKFFQQLFRLRFIRQGDIDPEPLLHTGPHDKAGPIDRDGSRGDICLLQCFHQHFRPHGFFFCEKNIIRIHRLPPCIDFYLQAFTNFVSVFLYFCSRARWKTQALQSIPRPKANSL